MTSTPQKPKQFQAIKGVRDILPPESALWNRVEQAAREVFETFGFADIRLPIFEPTELFARSVGQETDIVSKEMYTFLSQRTDTFEALQHFFHHVPFTSVAVRINHFFHACERPDIAVDPFQTNQRLIGMGQDTLS